MTTRTGPRTDHLLGGRYTLGPVIGRGGMGEVHRARDQRLARDVAVKVLRAELSSPADRARFEREARAAARVSHPNVVAVYDVGEHDGRLYLVMECLPGRTLAGELRDGPLPADRARRIALELLGALAAAHAQGVLHRDLKPGNVLFTHDGIAKLGDFGIAKLRDDADLTEVGSVIGTARYMAPERLRGEPATEVGDVYGMGVLLYEAVTGTCPFDGTSPAAVAHAIATRTPRPVASVRADCDPQLAAAIDRAIAKDPTARFPSAGAMAAAIAGAAAGAIGVGTPSATTAPPAPTLARTTSAMALSAAPWAATAPAAVLPTAVAPPAQEPRALDPTARDATAAAPTRRMPSSPLPGQAAVPPGDARPRGARRALAAALALLVAVAVVAAVVAAVMMAATTRDGVTTDTPPTTTVAGDAPVSSATTAPAPTTVPATSTTTPTTSAPTRRPEPAPAAPTGGGKGKGGGKKG